MGLKIGFAPSVDPDWPVYCIEIINIQRIYNFGLYFFEELISQNNPIQNWAWF